LSGNDNIHNETHYIASNIKFFGKMLKIVCSVDKYQLPILLLLLRNTYNNALNSIRDACCQKQTV